MKIDFSRRVTTIGDQPVHVEPDAKEPATLAEVGIFVLGAMTEREESAETRYRRYRLARRIETGGEIELKAEDVAFLKGCAGKVLVPFAYGAVVDLLDPPAE